MKNNIDIFKDIKKYYKNKQLIINENTFMYKNEIICYTENYGLETWYKNYPKIFAFYCIRSDGYEMFYINGEALHSDEIKT